MKDKRITIIRPEFMTALEKLKDKQIDGLCANIHCDHHFTFTGSFIIEKMIPHIEECKKRIEKRGSYKWIEHFCEKCGKKFVWDIPIYIRVNGDKIEFRYELKTMKYLGSFNRKENKRL